MFKEHLEQKWNKMVIRVNTVMTLMVQLLKVCVYTVRHRQTDRRINRERETDR
jgi:hypothetical protein